MGVSGRDQDRAESNVHGGTELMEGLALVRLITQQLVNRLQYPLPHRQPLGITALDHGVGPLGGLELGILS